MAMLYSLWSLKAAGLLEAQMFCAHINHQLRGKQADDDEDFVISRAVELNLPVYTSRINVPKLARQRKLSIETAARDARIEQLLNIARDNDCNCIATAHQMDDNAETIIQRLARGTGFRGLAGIRPKQPFDDSCFIRPLLCVTRRQIVDYLTKRDLKWREDLTNQDCTFRRNFIRHRLLPALQQQSKGSLVQQLFVLSQTAQGFCECIRKKTEDIWPGLAKCSNEAVTIDLKGFLAQPEPVRVELIHQSLLHLGAGLRHLSRQHYQMITELAQAGISGKKVELPDGLLAWREYRGLIFAGKKSKSETGGRTDKSVNLKVPGQTKLGNYLIDARILGNEESATEQFKAQKSKFMEYFDLDKLGWPLTARFRRTGDRFRPLGSAGTKKVGKFLTDVKVTADVRNNIIIFCDNEKIIWVAPIRISDQAKVADRTRRILQLQIKGIKKQQS